ncbi:MAG: phosphate acyltransferase PlsX [Candidatus Babeliales bacterium]
MNAKSALIAIDAMGGDFAPSAVIEGALRAAKKGIAVALYGDQNRLIEVLNFYAANWEDLPIFVHHCTQVINMADEPGRSVRKTDSSLMRAIEAVAEGKADAIVSAGNSGAALVAGMLKIGRIPGILRPAIGGFLPTHNDSVFCLDLGANVDCKPEYLHQFALMGDAYVRLVKNIEKPRIGLLSNGTESSKGTKLIQQVHELLSQSSMHFIGNCEPNDIFSGVADVVVCEGFSGNIMLKAIESTVQVITQWLKDEGNRSLLGMCAGILGAPVFKRLKKHIKKAQRGGALLLGVSKPLIIAHGSSNALAIEDAISFAHDVVLQKFHINYNNIVLDLLNENKLIQTNFNNRTVEKQIQEQ